MIIEALLAISLLPIIITAIVGVTIYTRSSAQFLSQKAQGLFLAEEGLEVVRNMRDQNWNNLPDGTYGLVVSNNQWQLVNTNDTQAIFTRQINISSLTAEEKHVTVEVRWSASQSRESAASLQTILSDWRE